MSKTIIVGLSGGVDSSVSAFLLKEAGYKVIGLFMKNWEETNAVGVCTATKDYEDVIRVADHLDIPYYNVNFAKEYQEEVFTDFIEALQQGLTPNPDIFCNREIKFKHFLNKALSLGADAIATGHYCRLDPDFRLLKGKDPAKDQSYFLYATQRHAFQKVLFPIGHLTKQEVRALAKKANLPTATKKDSTGICFIGKRDFKSFIEQYIQNTPGDFQTLDGRIVGQHDGVSFYTIGQRKGLQLGGEGDPWYVVDKDIAQNIVFVERGDHPALLTSSVTIHKTHWLSDLDLPLECHVKIRYRQEDQPCTLTPLATDTFRVDFHIPQRAVTPGQSAVFYTQDICLGGGIIFNSLHRSSISERVI